MEFVNPSFLYGLFATAIPIIIHLFNFRKFKKVAFTNVRFLKEVKEETQSKSKLKHLLVLLSRILAILFLVLAFAQPYIPAKKQATHNQNAVSIFIDNSFSMNAEGENGQLLQIAKKYAADIANSYSTTDKFQLVTNNFHGKHRHFFNKDEFIDLLQDIESSPLSKNTSEIIQRQTTDLLDKENYNKTIYYLSDFQESTSNIAQIKQDSTITINLIPLPASSLNNLYIDSIWFESPTHQTNNAEKLHVKIVNTSSKSYTDIPLKVIINGKQKALSSFSINGNEFIDSTLTFTNTTTGNMQGIVSIQDYPITYDDKLFFSYRVADSIPIMYVFENDTNSAIKSILENNPLFKVTYMHVNKLDYSQIFNQKLVLLESLKYYSTGLISELDKFVSNGNSIFIIPPAKIDRISYNELAIQLQINPFATLNTTLSKVITINLEDVFFKNVFEKIPQNIDLPIITTHYTTSKKTKNSVVNLLTLNNGSGFLSKYTNKKGTIYTLNCPLNESFTNFTKHAIFVPTIYKMALLSFGSKKNYYTIGKDNSIELPNINTESTTTTPIHIISDNEFDIIPEIRKTGFKTEVFLHNQITVANNYNVSIINTTIMSVGFNYNKSESIISTYSKDKITEITQNNGLTSINVLSPTGTQITTSLKELNEGISYWKYCIMLTLLFFGIEILLLKFWRQ